VLHADSIAIGPLISFEATFSDLPRREVQLGARSLVYARVPPNVSGQVGLSRSLG